MKAPRDGERAAYDQTLPSQARGDGKVFEHVFISGDRRQSYGAHTNTRKPVE